MSTIYGESPEIQPEDGYAANGGVALFSTRSAGETITSSDQGGEHVVGGRILWSITDLGNDEYQGGITGVDWMPDYSGNPFNNFTNAQIWEIASANRNLNVIFNQFSNPFDFAGYVYEYRRDCMSGTPY